MVSQSRDVMLKTCQNNSYAMQYIDKKYLKDKSFILDLLDKNVMTLRFIDNSLKKDIDIAIKAINKFVYSLELLDDSVKNNKKILEIINKKKDTLER